MRQVVTGNLSSHIGFNATVFTDFCTQRYINLEIGKYTKLTGHLTHDNTRELVKHLEDDYDNGLLGHYVVKALQKQGLLTINDLYSLAKQYSVELKHLFFILSLCLDLQYAQHFAGNGTFLPHQFRQHLFYKHLARTCGEHAKATIEAEAHHLAKENNLPFDEAELLSCMKNHAELTCQMSHAGLFYIPCTRYISHARAKTPSEYRRFFQATERVGLKQILDDAQKSNSLDEFRKGRVLSFVEKIGVKINKTTTQQQLILWEFAGT